MEKTTENLSKYRQPNKANFVYSIFSQPSSPFFSLRALEKIVIRRLGNSDLIDINYTCSDPGIAQNTIAILEDELTKAYEILRFSSTRNVIAYFEEQVRKAKVTLTKEEDDLMRYNVQEEVINYGEQTKALAITKYEVDDATNLPDENMKELVPCAICWKIKWTCGPADTYQYQSPARIGKSQ